MIKHPFIVAIALFVASLAGHGAILSITDRSESAEIAGGAGASVAQIGNSFQDMAIGVMTAEPMTEAVEETTPDIQSRTETTTITGRDNAPGMTQPVQSNVQAQIAEPVAQQTVTTLVETPRILPATIPVQAQPDAVMQATPVVTIITTPEITPNVTKPIQTALSEPPEENVRVSRRPAIRPKALEQAVAAATPKPKTVKPRKPKPRGNAETRARAGVVEGKPAAVATVAVPRKAAVSSKAANAAISNYPGLVMRRLARQKRPRAASKGTAIISFTVSASGGVALANITKSSGSAKLDKDALALVRRAGPFPAPPKGVQRSFKVRIKGR